MKSKEHSGSLPETLRRKQTFRMLILTVVCIAVCIAARVPKRLVFLFDQRSEEGSMAGLSGKERMKLMQKAADESRFSFRINGRLSFERGNAKGILFIENPKENTSLLKVKITLDQDGRVLYQTGYMKPGTGIGKDRLKEALPKGEYEATAHFTAFDDERRETGKAQAGIHITIHN